MATQQLVIGDTIVQSIQGRDTPILNRGTAFTDKYREVSEYHILNKKE